MALVLVGNAGLGLAIIQVFHLDTKTLIIVNIFIAFLVLILRVKANI